MSDEKNLAQLRSVINVSQHLCAQTDAEGIITAFAFSTLSLSQADRARVIRKHGDRFVIACNVVLIDGQPSDNANGQSISPGDPPIRSFDCESSSMAIPSAAASHLSYIGDGTGEPANASL